MARARQTVAVTKTRVKKDGSQNSEGYVQCNICHGAGVLKKGYNKKKK